VKPWAISAEEARELARRDAETRASGGIPHEDVVRKMIADMERDLCRMVAEYDGSPARSLELLEALAIAEEEGVPPSSCAKIRHEHAVRIRELHAA
jgi:hypothetical protein